MENIQKHTYGENKHNVFMSVLNVFFYCEQPIMIKHITTIG